MKALAFVATLGLGLAALSPAQAGDAAAGEAAFKRCKVCHAIIDDKTTIVKGGKTGPNLFGVIGRTAGTEAGFRKYGKSLVEAGEKGLVWDETNIVAYAADPQGFLQAFLDSAKAKSGMKFNLGEGVEDIAAYLASVQH